MNLQQEIKHHECVKRVDIQDEKSLLIILRRYDTDTLHKLPAFYEGFKVYHKVEGEEAPKQEKKPESKKKDTLGSGQYSSAEGKKSRDDGEIKITQW